MSVPGGGRRTPGESTPGPGGRRGTLQPERWRRLSCGVLLGGRVLRPDQGQNQASECNGRHEQEHDEGEDESGRSDARTKAESDPDARDDGNPRQDGD